VEVSNSFEVNVSHLRDYVQRPFQRVSFDVSGVEDTASVLAGVLQTVNAKCGHTTAQGKTLLRLSK